jgi:TatD DNase family protein
MLGTNAGAGVEAGAVDTHCHLFLLDGDPVEAVERAREAGVDRIVCVGIDPLSSLRSVEMAESFRGVFATAGMHPHSASALDEAAGAELEELLANPQVVGVGETGLDHYRMRSPREDQERAFRLHVGWSAQFDKPLVVHVRDAWPDVLKVLADEGAERVVLHCFSGDRAVAEEASARRYFLSFAGNVTYPKNDSLRESAQVIPRDLLLVETDSPFLSPQALRGRDNTPANVIAVIEALAQIRGEDPEDLLAATSANARAAFPGLR